VLDNGGARVQAKVLLPREAALLRSGLLDALLGMIMSSDFVGPLPEIGRMAITVLDEDDDVAL
jgi:hypothetical protein